LSWPETSCVAAPVSGARRRASVKKPQTTRHNLPETRVPPVFRLTGFTASPPICGTALAVWLIRRKFTLARFIRQGFQPYDIPASHWHRLTSRDS
jgi:hypothetical protein